MSAVAAMINSPVPEEPQLASGEASTAPVGAAGTARVMLAEFAAAALVVILSVPVKAV
jgi:hypothetical protein